MLIATFTVERERFVLRWDAPFVGLVSQLLPGIGHMMCTEGAW
jgi:hypothetical protein